MEKEKLDEEKWRIRRAIVETTKSLSGKDTARVLVYARRLQKAQRRKDRWGI